MSRLFGPVRQNGYVVENLDQAIDKWVRKMGVGPFYKLPQVTFEQYHYQGNASSPELRIALANSGDLQIELIEQTNDAPSFYRDFLHDYDAGLQHLSVWSESYEADTQKILQHGLAPIQHGGLAGGIPFAYYDADLHPGCVMEVLDAQPHLREIFRLIREAAHTWDGRHPVRTI